MEEVILRKTVKFTGLTLSEEEKEQLTNAWYYHCVVNNKIQFYKKFESKTIVCKFVESKVVYVGDKAFAQQIFRCQLLYKKRPNKPFNFSVDFINNYRGNK